MNFKNSFHALAALGALVATQALAQAPIFGNYELVGATNSQCFLVTPEAHTLEILDGGIGGLDPGLVVVATKSKSSGGYSVQFEGYLGHAETLPNARDCITVTDAELRDNDFTLEASKQIFCRGLPDPAATMFKAKLELNSLGNLLVSFDPTTLGDPSYCEFVKL